MISEYQIQIPTIVWPVLLAKFILAFPMGFQSGERGLRHFHVPWPLRFRAFESQSLPRLGERSGDDGATILNIRPAQGEDLSAARTCSSADFEERCHAPRRGCRCKDQSLLRRGECNGPVLLWNRRLAPSNGILI